MDLTSSEIPAALPQVPARSESRRFVASLVITMAIAISCGLALRMPTQLTANDISRYATVWALLERGTYAIDDCPWAKETQDKVRKPEPGSQATPPPRALLFQQAAAARDDHRRRSLPSPSADRGAA